MPQARGPALAWANDQEAALEEAKVFASGSVDEPSRLMSFLAVETGDVRMPNSVIGFSPRYLHSHPRLPAVPSVV